MNTLWQTIVNRAMSLTPVVGVLFLTGCITPPREKLGVDSDNPAFYFQVAVSPDGKSVAATRLPADAVLVFDTATGLETLRFLPAELNGRGPNLFDRGTRLIGPAAVAFTPDQGAVAAYWMQHRRIIVWDVSHSNCLAQIHYQPGSICLALSPDGSRVAYEGTNGNLVVQELTNANPTVQFSLPTHRPQYLTLSPDNRWLAAIDKAGTTWIWNVQSGRLLQTIPKPSIGPMTSLAFSADGTMIARSERNLQIWRLDPREQLHFFESPRLKAGTRLLGLTISLLDDGKNTDPTAPFTRNHGAGPAAFSPDNKYVAVINSAATLNSMQSKPDMEVRVFSLETGELVSTLDWPDIINGLCFGPDGNRIATAGKGVEVWDWHTGQPAR